MTYGEQQANPFQSVSPQQQPQWAAQHPLAAAALAGLGQQAYGGWPQQAWGQQRQLSQQEIGEVVRQLVPILPHVLAQAQQAQFQPQAAYGFGQQRQLSPQDINEVVRQILPVLPQIAGALQSQQQPYGFMAASQQPQQQSCFGQQAQPFGQQAQPLGQGGIYGQLPQMQAAFGQQGFGQQRQLSQQDVQEVARHLATILPQVVGAIQSQQRTI
jgi:hypothetical protein